MSEKRVEKTDLLCQKSSKRLPYDQYRRSSYGVFVRGKDSYTLLSLLNTIRTKGNYKFGIFAFVLDQSQPGWNDDVLRGWLDDKKIPYEILTRDTYSIVKEKIPAGKRYCSLCSRLRRGIIYRYAEEQGLSKIALGRHRDDLIQTLL